MINLFFTLITLFDLQMVCLMNLKWSLCGIWNLYYYGVMLMEWGDYTWVIIKISLWLWLLMMAESGLFIELELIWIHWIYLCIIILFFFLNNCYTSCTDSFIFLLRYWLNGDIFFLNKMFLELFWWQIIFLLWWCVVTWHFSIGFEIRNNNPGNCHVFS